MTDTALYEYAAATYERMDRAAKPNKYGEREFKGYLTATVKETGASSRYYSLIRSLLLSPDLDPCIEIRQRGNSSQPSIIVLHHPPPSDWGRIAPGDLTGPGRSATLLAELEAEVERLRAWRESIGEVNLSEVLRNFESRIKRLEREVKSGKTKT